MFVRQYSSVQNLHADPSSATRLVIGQQGDDEDKGQQFARYSSTSRIPQPPPELRLNPSKPSSEARQIQNHNLPSTRHSISHEINKKSSETPKSDSVGVGVRELRNQVNMLSHELRQLRCEFGSVQHLRTIDEDHTISTMIGGMDSGKPPLPPRLYRPAKPQRTFAHGSSSVLDLHTSMDNHQQLSRSSFAPSSAHSSFRSDRAPPPPPPRLGVTRSLGPTIQTAPILPPKPAVNRSMECASTDKVIRTNSARQSSNFPPAQGRPAHIHTNGSINLSPPYQSGQNKAAFTYQSSNNQPLINRSDQSRPYQSNGLPPYHQLTKSSPPYQQEQPIISPPYHHSQSGPYQQHPSPHSCGHSPLKSTGKPPSYHSLTDKPSPYQSSDASLSSLSPPDHPITAPKLDSDAMERLTQFGGDPLTDSNLARNLDRGFKKGVCWYELGPVMLFMNPNNDDVSSSIMTKVRSASKPIRKLAEDVHARFLESDVSQAVVFSGERGSGKSYLSTQLLNELFRRFTPPSSSSSTSIVAGSPPIDHNPIWKQFAASYTLLRSVTSVRRKSCGYSSQAAYTYELHISDGLLYKTKMYSNRLDYARLIDPPADESNFEIFYQMMAGLNEDEKKKFHLSDYSLDTLHSLRSSISRQNRSDQAAFGQFKAALQLLGIPFSDIMRILAAALLLGNVRFTESGEDGGELTVEGNKELDSASALLGITTLTLYKSLTKRQRPHKLDQPQLSTSSSIAADYANSCISSLRITLYHRCISAIIRRANSVKAPATAAASSSSVVRPASGVSSSDESSVHDSGIGIATSQGSPNIGGGGASNKEGYSTTSSQGLDGVVTVVEWFGFEDGKHNGFEHLCANMASEKMQRFYRTQVFKRNDELARAEGVHCDFDWRLFVQDDAEDTVTAPDSTAATSPLCLEGIMRTLEKSSGGEGVEKVSYGGIKPASSPDNCESPDSYIVKHYGDSDVVYHGVSDYALIDRDQLSLDIIRIFSSQTCNFGFLSYLFAPDLRRAEGDNADTDSKTRMTPMVPGDSRSDQSTFTQDFMTQANLLLRNISGARVQFVHCIKPDPSSESLHFDTDHVIRQCKRMDILATVHLLNAGLPYVMDMKEFNDRYRFLALKYHSPMVLKRAPNTAEEARLIVDCYLRAVDESDLPYISNHWAIGTEHVFLSDGARVQLELLRDQRRIKAAAVIQYHTRRWLRKKHNVYAMKYIQNNTPIRSSKARRSSCSLNMVNFKPGCTPPVPANRAYSIHVDKKINFPQRRMFTQNYHDPSTSVYFAQNQIVTALGFGQTNNQLLIRYNTAVRGKNMPCIMSVPVFCTKLCVG